MTETPASFDQKRTTKTSKNSRLSQRGKTPASPRQKEVSRANALEIQPWQNSTGPSSLEGKFFSSLNALKATWRHRVKASDPDFAEQIRECDLIFEEMHLLSKQQPVELETVVTDMRDGEGNLLARCYAAKCRRMDAQKWALLQKARAIAATGF